MKFHFIMRSGLLASLFLFCSLAWADSIQSIEKNFNFNWDNYKTVQANMLKVNRTEKFVDSIQNVSALNAVDREALAKLLYKLGTYYTHVSRQPDLAIAKLTLAGTLFTDKNEIAWNDNHLAYAYELKYAKSGVNSDKEKSLAYVNKVVNEIYPNVKNKQVAFAYCVEGLVFNDAKEYPQAEASYKAALKIYDMHINGQDDQYARTKNRLAKTILDQNGREEEALRLLLQLNRYWAAKGDISRDPYAARNDLYLGEAYLKIQKAKLASDQFKKAIAIYKNIYGENSVLLAEPYQWLAQAYKSMGDDKQAEIYQQRGAELNQIDTLRG